MINLLDLTTMQQYQISFSFIITLGIMLIYSQVFQKFKISKKSKVAYTVKSKVETLSMSMFFLLIFLISRCKIGVFEISDILYYFLSSIAMIVFIVGIIVNLSGRDILGKNWGNHIVIYKDHELVKSGVYKIVRHPLYASIIWMIYAVGIIYTNYLVIALNTIIFIPAMYYRSKQEEKELVKLFKEYGRYRKTVGMFFPKLGR